MTPSLAVWGAHEGLQVPSAGGVLATRGWWSLLGPWNWYLPRWLQWLPRTSAPAPPTSDQPVKQPITAT